MRLACIAWQTMWWLTRIFMEALKLASRSPKEWRSATWMEPGFSLKNLKAGLPAMDGITMVKGYVYDHGMEFGYAKTVHAFLVVAVMETRVRGGGMFLAVPPVTYTAILADS